MSTSIIHGQMSIVDANGNVKVMHQETSAIDILIDGTQNTQGKNDSSVIPSNVDTLQKLANKLGSLAFKSNIDSADLTFGFVVNNFTTTTEGSALDAVAGKNLNDRLTSIEEADVLVIGTDIEDTDDILPVSEIDDSVTSLASTWSSKTITDYIESLNYNFYVSLIENADEGYSTTVTLPEIEEAYQKGKSLWVTANDLHIPLRIRISATDWIFSGYTNGQACDIEINNNGVTVTYTEVAAAEMVQELSNRVSGVETLYDEETDTVTFI